MTCTLPIWLVVLMALVVTPLAALAGIAAFAVIERIGWMRNPHLTLEHNHYRNLWSSLGLLLAVFVVFPVAVAMMTMIPRPALCDAFGEYHQTY